MGAYAIPSDQTFRLNKNNIKKRNNSVLARNRALIRNAKITVNKAEQRIIIEKHEK